MIITYNTNVVWIPDRPIPYTETFDAMLNLLYKIGLIDITEYSWMNSMIYTNYKLLREVVLPHHQAEKNLRLIQHEKDRKNS